MKKTKLHRAAALLPLLCAVTGYSAQAESAPDEAPRFEVLNDCIDECGFPAFESSHDAISWLIAQGEGFGAPAGAGGSVEGANGPAGIGLGLGLGLNAPQVVYLEFEPGLPTYTFSLGLLSPALETVTFTGNDYVYSDADKAFVKERLEADYGPYNFEFVLEPPAEGDFVTLQFNSNDAPCAGTAGVCPDGGILFGSAGEIDFGNDNRSIVAINDANFWPFLNELDVFVGLPRGGLLELNAGIDVAGVLGDGPDAVSLEEAVRIAVRNQTANTGAHELGHGLGLRHYDAWGPIGGGLPSTGVPEPASFNPVYEGPSDADETIFHVMSSGASSDLPLALSANADRFFSERSAIKLAINERGRFVTDDQANSGQAKLKRLQVVNPILLGDNADGRFDVRNIVIEGRIDALDEVDTFTFRGEAGQVFNAEMISDVESFFFPAWDRMVGRLRLWLEARDGTRRLVAESNDEFESFDAFMLDAVLPEDGTYVLEMEAATDVFLGFDEEGRRVIISLPALGPATEEFFRLGQYITSAYIVESKPGRGPKKIGGPRR